MAGRVQLSPTAGLLVGHENGLVNGAPATPAGAELLCPELPPLPCVVVAVVPPDDVVVLLEPPCAVVVLALLVAPPVPVAAVLPPVLLLPPLDGFDVAPLSLEPHEMQTAIPNDSTPATSTCVECILDGFDDGCSRSGLSSQARCR
ncbi:MAG TPA: hypothetical protein VIV60_20845 [Polyangiaceae bacterium]